MLLNEHQQSFRYGANSNLMPVGTFLQRILKIKQTTRYTRPYKIYHTDCPTRSNVSQMHQNIITCRWSLWSQFFRLSWCYPTVSISDIVSSVRNFLRLTLKHIEILSSCYKLNIQITFVLIPATEVSPPMTLFIVAGSMATANLSAGNYRNGLYTRFYPEHLKLVESIFP